MATNPAESIAAAAQKAGDFIRTPLTKYEKSQTNKLLAKIERHSSSENKKDVIEQAQQEYQNNQVNARMALNAELDKIIALLPPEIKHQKGDDAQKRFVQTHLLNMLTKSHENQPDHPTVQHYIPTLYKNLGIEPNKPLEVETAISNAFKDDASGRNKFDTAVTKAIPLFRQFGNAAHTVEQINAAHSVINNAEEIQIQLDSGNPTVAKATVEHASNLVDPDSKQDLPTQSRAMNNIHPLWQLRLDANKEKQPLVFGELLVTKVNPDDDQDFRFCCEIAGEKPGTTKACIVTLNAADRIRRSDGTKKIPSLDSKNHTELKAFKELLVKKIENGQAQPAPIIRRNDEDDGSQGNAPQIGEEDFGHKKYNLYKFGGEGVYGVSKFNETIDEINMLVDELIQTGKQVQALPNSTELLKKYRLQEIALQDSIRQLKDHYGELKNVRAYINDKNTDVYNHNLSLLRKLEQCFVPQKAATAAASVMLAGTTATLPQGAAAGAALMVATFGGPQAVIGAVLASLMLTAAAAMAIHKHEDISNAIESGDSIFLDMEYSGLFDSRTPEQKLAYEQHKNDAPGVMYVRQYDHYKRKQTATSHDRPWDNEIANQMLMKLQEEYINKPEHGGRFAPSWITYRTYDLAWINPVQKTSDGRIARITFKNEETLRVALLLYNQLYDQKMEKNKTEVKAGPDRGVTAQNTTVQEPQLSNGREQQQNRENENGNENERRDENADSEPVSENSHGLG